MLQSHQSGAIHGPLTAHTASPRRVQMDPLTACGILVAIFIVVTSASRWFRSSAEYVYAGLCSLSVSDLEHNLNQLSCRWHCSEARASEGQDQELSSARQQNEQKDRKIAALEEQLVGFCGANV
jgi:hypothetical protein